MESSAMLMDGVVIRSALWRYRIGFGVSGIGRSFVRGREPVGRSSSADKIASKVPLWFSFITDGLW